MQIFVLKSCQKEIEEFPLKVREQLTDYLELLQEGQILFPPASKSLASIAKGLHELRMKDSSGQYRVIYIYKSTAAAYLVLAFKKTSQHIELRIRRTIAERLKQL